MILLSTAFILYLLACVFIPCCLYIFIQRFLLHKKTTFFHLFWVFVFLLYICMVLEVTGIGSVWDIGSYPGIIMKEKINLIPFPDGLEVSGILNIIMFMPLGFLLPLLWKEYDSFLKTTLCGFFFSFGIEFCQLFNNRVSDINDLITNTLGTAAGFTVWMLFSKIFRIKSGKRNAGFGKYEVAFYLLLSLAGLFFLYNWRWMLSITENYS